MYNTSVKGKVSKNRIIAHAERKMGLFTHTHMHAHICTHASYTVFTHMHIHSTYT